MDRGKFIVIEGPDCSGKGTLVSALKSIIDEENLSNFVFTREPGGFDSSICDSIRDMILHSKEDISAETEALLFATSRRHHIDLIEEKLSKGINVICERYIYSSIIYQGIARGLGEDVLLDMNKYSINKLKPDLVVFLDIWLDTLLERMTLRQERDNIELEGVEFFKAVVEGYKELHKDESINKIVIDSAKESPSKIADTIIKLI